MVARLRRISAESLWSTANDIHPQLLGHRIPHCPFWGESYVVPVTEDNCIFAYGTLI